MKHFTKLALCAFVFSTLGFASSALATATPVLSLSATGTGDNVQISINGDPNTSILLSYNKTGSGLTILPLGSTNNYGSYSNTLSGATYGFTSGTLITALLNGVNGVASNQVSWPSVTSSNTLLLSQNAVVVNAGSSASVTASNASGSGALYVSNNSNPSIANVSISGTTATIYGNVVGSTTITLCQVGNVTTYCPSIYVVVKQAGTGTLTFSQTNTTVVSGQNLPITVSGGNNSYSIANNSNSSVIQARISGSILTLSTGSTSGSATIMICSSDMALCGTIIATAGSLSSVSISFSTSIPTVAINQSTTVSIYGPSGVQFYVSSNLSPSIVQAYVSGSVLTLTGISPGTSSITVCSSTGNCSSLTATVQYVSSGGALTLSQNTLSLSSGQNVNITISGGSQPYHVSGGTSYVSQQTLSGNTLTIYGVASGISSVDVCSAGGACVSLVITVNGTNTSSILSIDPSSITITVGQSASVSLSGGTSNYSLTSNTNSIIASVSISGTSAMVTGISAGSSQATICSSNSSCKTLSITVNANVATLTAATPKTTASYVFNNYLAPNYQNADVWELQKILANKGYLSSAPTGYYGSQTKTAVMRFQSANGLEQLGVVGPSTRAVLNQMAVTSTSIAGTNINTMTMSQLQTRLTSLQTELSQILSRIAQLKAQGF